MVPLNPIKRLKTGFVVTWMILTLGLSLGILSRSGLVFAGSVVESAAGPTGFMAGKQSNQEIKEQVAFIQSEIRAVQQNLAWLELKIKHLEDFNRFVPSKLYDSLAFKKGKIASLKALKKRVDTLITPLTPATPKTASKGKTNFEKGVNLKIEQADLSDWVALVRDGDRLVMENRLPILFSSASADVARGYDPFIKKWATFLKEYDVRIMVKGYADSDPINTDKYPSNLELGAARAGAVVQRFISHGIKPGVFRISSTGEHRFEARKTREWKNLQRHANVLVEFKTMD